MGKLFVSLLCCLSAYDMNSHAVFSNYSIRNLGITTIGTPLSKI